MLKLFVYGYSYGADRSSRKLERAINHNRSFIWLLGGLRPDHKTIANIRRQNKDAPAQVLKQSARMCLKLGLIDGNILFVDGVYYLSMPAAAIVTQSGSQWFVTSLPMRKVSGVFNTIFNSAFSLYNPWKG